MICYRDRTFCSSKVKHHTCGRQLFPHHREEAQKADLPIALAKFCEFQDAYDEEAANDKEHR
jgi:hypothetical protein